MVPSRNEGAATREGLAAHQKFSSCRRLWVLWTSGSAIRPARIQVLVDRDDVQANRQRNDKAGDEQERKLSEGRGRFNCFAEGNRPSRDQSGTNCPEEIKQPENVKGEEFARLQVGGVRGQPGDDESCEERHEYVAPSGGQGEDAWQMAETVDEQETRPEDPQPLNGNDPDRIDTGLADEGCEERHGDQHVGRPVDQSSEATLNS